MIVVVGVGALGSHVVLFLRNVETDLRIVDLDRVEQKNVLAQFHGKPGVGKNKTQSLQQTMQFLYGVKLTTIPHKLVSDNARELLSGADLVIDCLDDGPSREVVQGFVRENEIPCLHGAMSADGIFGRVCWDEYFVIDSADVAGAPTCEGGEHLPFIGVVSALLARSAQEFLHTGKKKGYEYSPGGVIIT